MDHEKNLNLLRPKFEALTAEETRTPDMPVDVFIQEAEDLLNQVEKDKKQLLARGLYLHYVDELHAVISALRQAQSNWIAARHSRELSDEKWSTNSPIAYGLRNEMIDELNFAFHGNRTLVSRINEIKQGDGDADMIQDLNDLRVLANKNIELLKHANFNAELLVQVSNTTDLMADLLAETNSYKGENNNNKLIRDKAYSYLHVIISEIRRVGKFVFRNNAEHAAAYASAYKRK